MSCLVCLPVQGLGKADSAAVGGRGKADKSCVVARVTKTIDYICRPKPLLFMTNDSRGLYNKFK